MTTPPAPPLGLPHLAGCPDCGLFQRLPGALPPRAAASCLRCDAVLRRQRRDPFGAPLALILAALLLALVALSLPLLAIDIRGRGEATTLATLPLAFDRYRFWELSALTAATVVLLPVLRLLLLLAVLLGLRLPAPPRRLYLAYRWQAALRPWAMTEVFLLGVFVAYTRLVALAEVEVGPALWALGAVMLAMCAADAAQDGHAVWQALERRGCTAARRPLAGPQLIACTGCGLVSRAAEGARCPRCATRLHRRRPGSVGQAWALVAAAAILYLPANAYPVMTVTYLGRGAPHTILGGAEDLVSAGLWPLALLVFVASIAVPVLKLAGLGLLLVASRRGARGRLRDLMRLYRIVEAVGRWSMIDVFMLATLVALVQAGVLATVTPGLGALAFAAVVVLTMLAAERLDPRLVWDAAERRGGAA
ncbi:paraquat-inducible protein A [Paracraurococcus lichenis]|uniref:Paraquat-inducible protein A n=1 Tax=Paracraurococcus lichenis TaxID=3064888 RepID=A0ABT9DXP5_9PROT|nr:paraquat-inducible protein A [Paracraurococcus sp. LOR1-02]MDO9708667.1 paraquat-inducible protein A [Paracraurococcus sp. LOR1-02]